MPSGGARGAAEYRDIQAAAAYLRSLGQVDASRIGIYGGSYGGYLIMANHRTEEFRDVNAWPDNPMGHGAENYRYRFQWNFPLFFSPHKPYALYAAANVLFRATNHGAAWEIISPPENFEKVRDAVKALGVEPASAEVAMVPQNYVKLQGKEASQMVKLMEVLEDHDDVQHVWSNFDIEEKEIEASLA